AAFPSPFRGERGGGCRAAADRARLHAFSADDSAAARGRARVAAARRSAGALVAHARGRERGRAAGADPRAYSLAGLAACPRHGVLVPALRGNDGTHVPVIPAKAGIQRRWGQLRKTL